MCAGHYGTPQEGRMGPSHAPVQVRCALCWPGQATAAAVKAAAVSLEERSSLPGGGGRPGVARGLWDGDMYLLPGTPISFHRLPGGGGAHPFVEKW